VTLSGEAKLLGSARPGANGIHVVVVNDGGATHIRDVSGQAGLCVDGNPISEAQLTDGALVRLGKISYRFRQGDVAPKNGSRPVAPPAQIRVQGAGGPVPLDKPVVVIGAAPTADVQLSGEGVAASHTLIISVGGRHVLRDLDSGRPTLVNANPVKRVELVEGDLIRIGSTEVRYVSSMPQPASAVAPPPPVAPPAATLPLPSPPPVAQPHGQPELILEPRVPPAETKAPVARSAPPPPRQAIEPARNVRGSQALTSWGPLARAVMSTREPEFFEAAPAGTAAPAPPRRRRLWLWGIVALLLAGVAAVALSPLRQRILPL
jgi:pSer/pThr/pTyr-binding forkhead associated (FHA) protein